MVIVLEGMEVPSPGDRDVEFLAGTLNGLGHSVEGRDVVPVQRDRCEVHREGRDVIVRGLAPVGVTAAAPEGFLLGGLEARAFDDPEVGELGVRQVEDLEQVRVDVVPAEVLEGELKGQHVGSDKKDPWALGTPMDHVLLAPSLVRLAGHERP